MSSLVGAIFGSKDDEGKEDSSSLSNLFAKSSCLPERPQHEALPLPPRKREENPKKKKRKRKAEKTEELEENEKSKTDESNESNQEKNSNETDEAANQEADSAEDRTIFVGNLPLSTTRKSLAALFRSCGKIESTRLRSIAAAGVKLPPERAGDQNLMKKVCANTNTVDADAKSTAQGYVVFARIESVETALELNNTLVDKQFRLRVDRANNDATRDASRSVFVGNLPYHANEESLRQHFTKGCGLDENIDVEGVRLIRDKDTMQCKGFGYVLFRDKSMVAIALQKMHESTYMKRSLRVMVCGKRYKGRRGEAKELSTSSTSGDGTRIKRSFEGRRATKATTPTTGATQRILDKQAKQSSPTKKRRARGDPKKTAGAKRGVQKAGVSKRAAAHAKAGKRVKQIQKRLSKGMGKTRR